MRVREALRTAREYYHRTPYAPWLRTLAQRLEGPPHIAVRAAATQTLTSADPLTDGTALGCAPDVALAAALRDRHPTLKFIELSAAPSELAGVRDPTAGTAAVLEVTTELEPGRDSVETIDHASPRRDPRTAGGRLIVVFSHPPATATLAGEATRDDHADQITNVSGLHRLSALLEAWAAGRWDAVAAWSVLVELEQLVRVEPPAQGADQLWWQLERIRATSHELAELDLIEQLRGGWLQVPQADRGVVLRLLGADGADPRTRLGLGADADLDRVRAAAAQQRDRWQQLAAHPASSRALRTLAETAAGTCMQLLSVQYRHRDTPRDPFFR
jgi:hypothetical protein